MTGQELINAALLALGAFDPGETPSTDESNAGLIILNSLLDNWSSQELMALAAVETTQALSNGVQSYVVSRLAKLVAATHVFNSATFPVEVVPANKWASIVDRNHTGLIVKYAFYNRLATNPTIQLSPAPTSGSLIYIGWAALTQVATLGTAITFLPGYQRALTAALAKAMAGPWQIAMTPELKNEYDESMAELRRLNAELMGDMGAVPVSTPSPVPPTAAAPASQ